MPTLKSSPSTAATIYESPLYRIMGTGLTDTIFLLGHADGIPLNDPYLVTSMQDMVDTISDGPLKRAALECYFAGARDIWIMAVAPMSEHPERDPGKSYDIPLEQLERNYQLRLGVPLFEESFTIMNEPNFDVIGRMPMSGTPILDENGNPRMTGAYEVLRRWDIPDIVVPVGAPFNADHDFLGPLAYYCQAAYAASSTLTLGVLGTTGIIDQAEIDAMVADPRLTSLGDAGSFISIYAGDGVYNFEQFETTHTSSVATTAAAMISQLPLNRGMTHQNLRNVSRILGPRLTKTQIETLAEAGINPCGNTVRGRRGIPFQVVSYTDNTLAPENSSFWSLAVIRLATRVTESIQLMGKRRLGTTGLQLFRDEVHDYLTKLLSDGFIREFEVDIDSDSDYGKVYVDLVLMPYTGLRHIEVSVSIGPLDE